MTGLVRFIRAALLLPLFLFLFPVPVGAIVVCPVCAVATGACLGVSRFLGVDDTVSSVWIGGLVVAVGLWLAGILSKKGFSRSFLKPLTIGLVALLTFVPLYWGRVVGFPGNTLQGVDKVVLGSVVGAGLFLLSLFLDGQLRKTNGGRVYFSFQRVVLPLLFLLAGSLGFYILTK